MEKKTKEDESVRDSSCCKLYYVEYSPEWGILNGWEYIKSDGMRCSEHSKPELCNACGVNFYNPDCDCSSLECSDEERFPRMSAETTH